MDTLVFLQNHPDEYMKYKGYNDGTSAVEILPPQKNKLRLIF